MCSGDAGDVTEGEASAHPKIAGKANFERRTIHDGTPLFESL
jgi:hypothetical protein